MTRWEHLIESDASLRVAERAFRSDPTLDSLMRLRRARLRRGMQAWTPEMARFRGYDALVIHNSGRVQKELHLGWLHRHQHEIDHFVVEDLGGNPGDAMLRASLRNGQMWFEALFASIQVLWDSTLRRSPFVGLPVDWMGHQTTAGTRDWTPPGVGR